MKIIRILIADDHPRVRESLKALLEAESDLEVVGTATDGDEALALSDALHPDIILLDVQMPRKNGIVVLKELCDRQMPPRVLLLSGADDGVLRAGETLGACCCLAKGLEPQALIEHIRRVITQ